MIKLLCALFFLSSAASSSDLEPPYFQRVKKNHSSDRAVQILSKRLALEIEKKIDMDIQFAALCLFNIKEVKPATYKNELSLIANKIRQLLTMPTTPKAQTDSLFSFIAEVSLRSLEDAFYLIEQAVPPERINGTNIFFPSVLGQMRPDLYIIFFESIEKTIIKDPSKYRELIEFYCLSNILVGQTKQCLEKIKSLKSLIKNEPWIQLQEFIARLTLLDFEESNKILKTMNEDCAPLPSLPWFNYHAARFHRVRKNTKKSLDCLEAFKNDSKEDPTSLLFYKLEYAKTIRFLDLNKSEAAIAEAEDLNLHPKESFSFFNFVIDVEKTKNFVIKKDKINIEKYLLRLTNQYKAQKLKPYSDLIFWLKNYSEGTKAATETSDSFELYDFSVFIKSIETKSN